MFFSKTASRALEHAPRESPPSLERPNEDRRAEQRAKRRQAQRERRGPYPLQRGRGTMLDADPIGAAVEARLVHLDEARQRDGFAAARREPPHRAAGRFRQGAQLFSGRGDLAKLAGILRAYIGERREAAALETIKAHRRVMD